MIPYWTNGRVVLWQGHVLDALAAMEAGSAHCCITSPPYWGLRDYGLEPIEWGPVSYAPMAGLPEIEIPGCAEGCEHVWGEERVVKVGRNDDDFNERTKDIYGKYSANHDYAAIQPKEAHTGQYCQLCGGWRGCLGLEPTVEMFVGHIVLVARELWRVLREDGTFWLNFGDSYSGGGGYSPGSPSNVNRIAGTYDGSFRVPRDEAREAKHGVKVVPSGLKPKDLIGIPWLVAFALQADGWYLRSDIIWAKGVSFCPTYSGSCMPESVRDRPTKGHEYVFLLSKSKRYFYDATAVREANVKPFDNSNRSSYKDTASSYSLETGHKVKSDAGLPLNPSGRNLRTVWTINPGSYAGAHFATFPPALVEPMIKAGTSQRGCCPECGAPWERVTEKAKYEPDILPVGVRQVDDSRGDKTRRLDGKSEQWKQAAQVTTTGWTPTCSHYDWDHCAVCGTEMDDYDQEHGDRLDCGHNICAECLMAGEAGDHVRECTLAPVPCTVLDPFLGSGTTAEVAIRLGRRAVGIELSQDYCDDHIIPRLDKDLQMELL
jgi:DNA modification methylase